MVRQELHGDHGEDALKNVNSGWNLQDLVREGHGLFVPLLTDDKGLTSTSDDLKMKMDMLHTFQFFDIRNSKLNRSFLVESFRKTDKYIIPVARHSCTFCRRHHAL